MKVDMSPILRGVAITILGSTLVSGGATLVKTAGAVSVLQSERSDDHERLVRMEAKIDKLLEKTIEPRN